MSEEKIEENKITKVLLSAGWIPVDKESFKLGWFKLGPERVPGFSFESEKEIIRGPIASIQAIK